MGYIYDALKRAEAERESTKETRTVPYGDRAFIGSREHDEDDMVRVEIESVAEYIWRPLVASFPTLAQGGPGLEQFRSLRSRIYQASSETPLKTILVTGGMPQEGKSFVASNLAMSLSRNDNSVLLIDADMRRPSVYKLLGTHNEPGLAEYLSGTAEMHQVMQRCSSEAVADGFTIEELASLTFMPAGTPKHEASELITNQRLTSLLAAASEKYDWVIVDSPPVLVFTDAIDLARAVDGVLVVMRSAKTTYEEAQRTKASLENARILGIVLNDAKNPPRSESYYSYYYDSAFADEKAETKK